MRNNKGITIIALIITIVLTLILLSVVIKFGTNEIDRAKIEDLKSTMLLIKGRAQVSKEKTNFEKDYSEKGVIQINDDLTLPEGKTYDLSSIQSKLNALADKSQLYIWEQTALNNNGIDYEITSDDFFVIDYNNMEVYSSIGYSFEGRTYYSLSQLQELTDEM